MKILIIKPGAIGDLLHITPAIRALKKHLPFAEIDIMVGSRGTTSLFTNNPHIRKVLFFDRKGEHRKFSNFLHLWNEVRREKYDLVANFQRSTVKVWLLLLAAMPCTVLVYHKTRSRKIHAVVNHLETFAPLGIDPQNCPLQLELYPDADDNGFAAKLLATAGIAAKPLIALNLGASNRIKCWNPLSFARLGDLVAAKLDATVVLVGGPDENDLAATVMAAAVTKPLNLVARLSLTQLGALLQRSAVLVSGDTGPLHLATAVGTRVIALFGAIDPERTGPVGAGHVVISHTKVPCVPCNGKQCRHTPHLECMTAISVEEVFAAVSRMFDCPQR